jgi:A/G-specific adenine glycosylase
VGPKVKSCLALLSPGETGRFQEKIYGYWRQHGRDLPWRRTRDEYRIFVSEVMLQQTQVDRVMAKYEEFIYVFPSFSALADSPLKDVLTVWQGLGYNRRALALVQAARDIAALYSGRLPRTVEELSGLSGIGKATASAVLCFAFDYPAVFIETNVRRVFIDHFFEGRAVVGDKEILPLVGETLDRAQPRNWYYALMDYGAMLGKSGENANRKSAHYRKQAPFKDSDRRIRGAVLKLLLTETHISTPLIGRETGASLERVLAIMTRMEKEGLVREDGGRYTIGD